MQEGIYAYCWYIAGKSPVAILFKGYLSRFEEKSWALRRSGEVNATDLKGNYLLAPPKMMLWSD